MTKKIIKGLAALALTALAIGATPESAAFERVCMKADFGVGFVYKFRVAWGIQDDFSAAHRDDRPYNIDGVTDWSENVHLVRTQCVPLHRAPFGASFVVQMWSGNNRTLCQGLRDSQVFVGEKTHERENLSIWLNSSGATPDRMRCKPWKFE